MPVLRARITVWTQRNGICSRQTCRRCCCHGQLCISTCLRLPTTCAAVEFAIRNHFFKGDFLFFSTIARIFAFAVFQIIGFTWNHIELCIFCRTDGDNFHLNVGIVRRSSKVCPTIWHLTTNSDRIIIFNDRTCNVHTCRKFQL